MFVISYTISLTHFLKRIMSAPIKTRRKANSSSYTVHTVFHSLKAHDISCQATNAQNRFALPFPLATQMCA